MNHKILRDGPKV